MPSAEQIRSLLVREDRRTTGAADEVVVAIYNRPELVNPLVACVFEEGMGLRMRAADAMEKISRTRPELLRPYAGVLLELFEEAEQNEVLWHLPVLLPRLQPGGAERRRLLHGLQRCLSAKSSLVRTFALQGMADLAKQERSFGPLGCPEDGREERHGRYESTQPQTSA